MTEFSDTKIMGLGMSLVNEAAVSPTRRIKRAMTNVFEDIEDAVFPEDVLTRASPGVTTSQSSN